MSHRSGLERSDDLCHGTTCTRAEIPRRPSFQQRGSSFRVDGKVAAVECEDWATFGRAAEPPARR